MPFIRYLRDRRGYETTVVMHGYRPVQGPPKSRVLYLFRSPAHVQIGREALDEEVREALEHTHPDLSFDWIGLTREHESMRAHQFRERPQGPERRPPQGERPRQPVKAVVEDHSALGKALGAERAAALRSAYNELVQRIGRRARTPEERDRLLERAHRLNPDDWSDESDIRVQAGSFDALRQAIASELPARRRGRRGGRREEGSGSLGEGHAGSAGQLASAIISDDTREGEEAIDASGETSDLDPSSPAADRGNGDPVRPGDADQPAAGNNVSGDDEFRRD